MDDVRARLSHVLWIGGGPQAGKTTLSRLLAGKNDFAIYNLDWHGAREHASRALGPAATAFAALTMDQRWAAPTVPHLVERAVAVWSELFALVVEDLLARPRSRVIVAEGPGALPWCVAPLLSSPRQALFLTPTSEWRETVATRRWGPDRSGSLSGIVDRARAVANIRARDALLDARIVSSCAELGLRHERVDGSLDLDDSLALLEDQFREHLPATPNV